MRRIAQAVLSLAVTAGLFLSPSLARAQANTDYPTLKGNNARTGSNLDPANSSPGFLSIAGANSTSALRWFRTGGATFDIAIDNTDDGDQNQVDSSGNVVGPFDPQPNGVVTRNPAVASLLNRVVNGLSPANGWAVTNENNEAAFPYTLARRQIATPTLAADGNPRFASYEFTNATPSAPGRDPRQAATPAQLRTFTWTFTSPNPTPRNLALYAWIPVGQTVFGNDAQGNPIYRVQQRYFVYEVTYGTGQKYVDVVDTDASGAGYVRLGNGGLATDQVFPYAGINPATGTPYPVTITLYNTIPRDATTGDLLQTAVDTSGRPRLVYADAARFTDATSTLFATPTAAGFGSTTDRRVTSARNDNSLLAILTGNGIYDRPQVTTRAIVTSHDAETGIERWTFSPDDPNPGNVTLDQDTAAFAPTGGFVATLGRNNPTPNANPANAATTYGGTYLRGQAVLGDETTSTERVIVSPSTTQLPVNTSYEITTYVSGPDQAQVSQFATAVYYQIFEGDTSAGVFTLNQTTTRGFVRLGNRQYYHSQANPLRVEIYNTSPNAADVGREIMVDAVRFNFSVGTGNSITSTPVHATALLRPDATSPLVSTNVVLIADERGRIQCLDAAGNGDGTTKVYWTYPSTPTTNAVDANGDPVYQDPNLNPGQGLNDGGFEYDGRLNQTDADLPTGFDLSTAVVTRQTVIQGAVPVQRDFLIVGGSNGRVYCIAMDGRGDLTATAPGTTYRRWTYPDTSPSTRASGSQFGRITSVAIGDVANSTKVYFGTELGRFFCVEALGTNNQLYGNANRATEQVWQYPAGNVAPLGAIVGAPTLDVAGNRVFFGTSSVESTSGTFVSHLISLNATSGGANWDLIPGGTTGAIDSTNFLSWRAGTAYVPATELNSTDLAASVGAGLGFGVMPDTLFAMNENGSVYAINAASGVPIWRDTELQSGGEGSLGYVRLQAQDRNAGLGIYPTITVPTEGGRFAALFARLGDETIFSNIGDANGNRLAWGARVGVPIVASISTLGSPLGSNGFLYGASSDGTLYAFSGNNSAGGGVGIVNPPIYEDVPDNNNDGAYRDFRNAEVALLSRRGFVSLRQTQAGTTTGVNNYADVIDTALPITDPTRPTGKLKPDFRSNKTIPTGGNVGFEWGETIYLIIYNFPAPVVDTNNNAVAPPVVEVTVTTEGRASRPYTAEARLFRDKSSTDNNGGYAVLQIPLTSGGNTSLTPGPGLISAVLRTSATNGSFAQQSISLPPGQSRINYIIANPLGIAMLPNNRTAPPVDGSGNPFLDAYQLGATNVAGSPDNVNGSPNVSNTLINNRNSSLLAQSFGSVQHAQSGKTRIAVYDRSLITLLRGEGRGLEGIRVDRRDLEWQGGADSVAKAIVSAQTGRNAALFGKFEDLPTQLPNVSLDYPNIGRTRVAVTKDPDGVPENPIFGAVGLTGPRAANGTDLVTDGGVNGGADNTQTRRIFPTPFEFRLDVPKYQPPALVPDASLIPDSAGNRPAKAEGYGGRYSVFVDSDGNGLFNGIREAYRSFNLFTYVAPDERLVVTTPNVDLGALAGGAGYDVTLGYGGQAPYRGMGLGGAVSPWTGPYQKLFAPFQVLNEGNVNLLDVRVAKGSQDGQSIFPWQTFSLLNDDNSAWLDASLDVWSDLDSRFAPVWGSGTGGGNAVLGQKPRVTDLTGRPVQANPVSRVNPNLPDSGTALFTGAGAFEPRDPRIGVTIPLGFPMGPYSQIFRVIEDYRFNAGATNDDELLSLGYQQGGRVDPQESYSDPGVRVGFSVVETQLTGSPISADYSATNLAPKMIDARADVLADGTRAASNWSSRQPAAARAISGSVALVFASDRPQWEPAGKSPADVRPYRLWISTLAGGAPDAKRNGRFPDSQTRDLNRFVPANTGAGGGWWGQQVGAYPNGDSATLFPALPGAAGTANDLTMTFGNPALPVVGFSNPATYGTPGAAGYNAVTLAFVGSVDRQGASGAIVDTRLFATPLSLGANGAATVGDPVAMPFDPTSRKGKPAVLESTSGSGKGATIVYPVISGNASSLFVTRFQNNAFAPPIAIDLGTAFESAGEPSIALESRGNAAPVLNIAFSGRLRGRSGNEIFQLSLIADPATHLPLVPFQYVQYRVRGERATYDAASASYRVRGAYLREPLVNNAVPAETYDDRIYLRSNNGIDLRDTASRKTDRESRVESSTSRAIGGQIYLDRGAGSIRTVGGLLPRTAEVTLDYDAYVIRLTGNDGSGYGAPTLMRDTRLSPSNASGYDAYWFQSNGAPSAPGATDTFADRTYVLFSRAAQPGGQTVRPFMATTRYGTRLPRAIRTTANGTLNDPLTVTGANGPYQLDPASGKIYFTRVDSGNTVRITFDGVTLPYTIGIVGERAEEPLPLGRAINESNVTAFLDPVFNLPGESFDRRGLIWTFWSSTRGGAPNIFMGTIAPKLIPFAASQ